MQGIGFLGAGLILHSKSRVLGLTSAATVFVVAAVGMTCGAGLYLEALFATALLLMALQVVRQAETSLGRKRLPFVYEVRATVGMRSEEGRDEAAAYRMLAAILSVLDKASIRLQIVERDNIAGLERIAFAVLATQKTHTRLLAELKASDATDQVLVFRDRDDE